MAAPYEWLIGTRYLRATQRRGFLSFISVVSMLGLAIGVAVLIVVLSVMNGFERELREPHPERDLARDADGPRRHADRLAARSGAGAQDAPGRDARRCPTSRCRRC